MRPLGLATAQSPSDRLLDRFLPLRLDRSLYPPLIERRIALALPEVDLQRDRVKAEVASDAVLEVLHIPLGEPLDPVDEEEEPYRIG